MQFLSDEWLAALDAAARRHQPADDSPLAGVMMTIEQSIDGGPTWRLVIDHGALSVQRGSATTPADVRLTTDRATASAIASGQRAALDAFIAGDLVIGGDVRVMLEHREALEAFGDLFADLRAATEFG